MPLCLLSVARGVEQSWLIVVGPLYVSERKRLLAGLVINMPRPALPNKTVSYPKATIGDKLIFPQRNGMGQKEVKARETKI